MAPGTAQRKETMDIQTLIQFIDVCDLKSISKAADRHFISRQSLTEAMNRLEREVGATLLTRTHAGVTLTDEGQFFYQSMQHLVQHWMTSLEGLEEITRQKRALRLATTLALMDDETVCQLLGSGDFGLDRPIVLFDYPTETCWDLLKKGAVDVAYTLNPREEGQLVSTPVIGPFKSTYILISVNSPLASLPAVDASHLQGMTIQVPWLETTSNISLNEYIRRANAQALTVPNTHAVQKKLVQKETAYLVLPGSGVLEFDSPDLMAKRLVDFPHIMHQHLVWNRDASSDVSNACSFLIEFFKEKHRKTNYIEDPDGTIRFLR